MCIAFLAYNCLEKYLLVLAFNRDEVLDRDTRETHWWDDREGLVGGRDCVGGGTWLCAGVNGRVSFVTNVRKLHENHKERPFSRGVLPVDFVDGKDTPTQYLNNIKSADFPGFNLVISDLSQPPENGSQVHYFTNAAADELLGNGNAPTEPTPLTPGIHGLSNAVLDTPWPKVTRGRHRLDDLAGAGAFDDVEFPWDAMFAIMRDSEVLERDPSKLPLYTGYPVEFETASSAIFLEPAEYEGVGYGTRSVTVMAVPRDSASPVELREQFMTAGGGWAEERHRFHMRLHPTLLGA